MTATLYERLGEDDLHRLVERIYHWMAILPDAQAAMDLHHPDTSEVQRRLSAFLSGWLGGPDLFRPAYGEPFMRRRHMAFPIGVAERDAWMTAFRRALTEVVTDPDIRAELDARIAAMADHLRNRAESGSTHVGSCACQHA